MDSRAKCGGITEIEVEDFLSGVRDIAGVVFVSGGVWGEASVVASFSRRRDPVFSVKDGPSLKSVHAFFGLYLQN